MKHRILIVLLIGILALPEAAAAVSVGIKTAYFMPSEQAFKDIYGSGLMFGGEIGFRLSGPVKLWIDGMVYKGTGQLSYTKEDTTLTLIPIGAGLRYDFTQGPAVVYAGAGVRYYRYKESNVLGTVSAGGIGFVSMSGVNVRIAKGFLLDARAAYSYGQLTPADFTINVGGIELGGGLVIEF